MDDKVKYGQGQQSPDQSQQYPPYPPPYTNEYPQYPQYPQNTHYPPSYPQTISASGVPPPPAPSAAVPARPAVSEGWFERNRRNKPQSNSVGIATLLNVSGGMNIAWGFGFSSTNFAITEHMMASWFIGSIIGTIIGAIVVNRFHRKYTVLFSCLLVIFSGVLFLSLPHDYDGILIARYINGCAVGLIFVPTMVLAGEETVKDNRGMISATVDTMSFSLGIYIQILYGTLWVYNESGGFNSQQMLGAMVVFWGSLSFLIGLFLIIESPVYFLVRGDERNAIESLRRLRSPFVVNAETYEQLNEHKRYIAENNELTFMKSAIVGLPALLKLCLYRGLVALCFSRLFAEAMFVSAKVSSSHSFPDIYLIIYATLRWISAVISPFLMGTLGRKRQTLLGFLICGGMAIGVGAVFDDCVDLSSPSKMASARNVLFVFQLFSGFAISASSVYLCEAFPLAIKPYYIAIAFIVEMSVQIIVLSTGYEWYSVAYYFYTLGALSIFFSVFGLKCLPETKKTTLLEAQIKFRCCERETNQSYTVYTQPRNNNP